MMQCIFDDSNIQTTKTLSELQLRVVRLEAYIMHFAGSDLSPLSNFRGGGGVEFDDQVIYIPGNGAPPEPASASESRDTTSWTSIPSLNGSRKRRRQDESPDPDEVLRNESGPSLSARITRNAQDKEGHNTVERTTQSSPPPVASTSRLPAGSTLLQQSSPHRPTHHQRRSSDQERVQPIQQAQQAHTRTQSQEDRSHAYMDEAQHLDNMTEHNDSYEVNNAVFNEKLVYHPFTSRIRATARDIPPEEMFSTDEEDPSATREEEEEDEAEQGSQQATSGANRTRAQRSSLSMSTPASSATRDLRTLDDSAPRSPPLSSQRGFTNESSTGVATSTSTSMKRTGSASSAPAALGPTTAKISSSTNSELRVDKKGNLRYLGSASTSAVVAELADRQRWDVESPGLQEAAAARRRNSARTGGGPPTPGSAANANGEGGTASSSTGSLATVNEIIDLTKEDNASGKEQAAQQQFARPLLRPKPWEIFSNLGVTVAGALPPVEEVALPPEDLAKSLIDGFFEHLHPLYV